MLRIVTLGTIGSLAFSTLVYAGVCEDIRADVGTLDHDGLYWRLSGNGKWSPINAGDGFYWSGKLPRNRDVQLAYAIRRFAPAPQSGVLSIRLRTQAVGSAPDAARVAIHRPAIAEAC